MKGKPCKWGYKILALAGQSGYIYRFQVAGDNVLYHSPVEPEIGKSGLVVLELAESLPPGSQLYFDNWFCSPLLIRRLKEMGYGATGTLRQNRRAGCPLKKELKREGRGAHDYKSSDGVVVCDWNDNRIVSVVSNCHSVEPVTLVEKWSKKHNKYIQVLCPNLVQAYNRCMGGVDRCDMMLALYRMKMKGRKWYRRIFFHLTDLALINAWTMLRQTKLPDLKLVNYKLEVAVALIRGNLLPHPMAALASADWPGRRGSRDHAADEGHLLAEDGGTADDEGEYEEDPVAATYVNTFVRYDGCGHLPKKLAKLPKRCKMENCTRRSRMSCIKCKVYLCIDEKSDCFYRFHTKS